jgi:hypothetical protein
MKNNLPYYGKLFTKKFNSPIIIHTYNPCISERKDLAEGTNPAGLQPKIHLDDGMAGHVLGKIHSTPTTATNPLLW